MSEDFYSVLGVGRDAGEDEIKKAYRKKAAEYHPDVSDHPDAEEKFKQIKKAKEVLSDDEQRQMYDQLGHERFLQAEKHGGVGGAGGRGDPFGGAGGDPFGGGGIGDLFEQFFGGGGGQRRGPRAGRDLRTTLTINLSEAYHGTEKQVTITRPESCEACNGQGHPSSADAQTCSDCGGRGQVTRVQQTPLGRVQQRAPCQRCDGEGTIYSETCDECRGEGRVRREAKLQVEVPAGIQDGQTLRMEGEGAAGDPGARTGDLLIEVTVEPHPDFERDGADLYRQQAISFPQAVFGDTVEVETVDGVVEMDVPPGTQSGERFRLRGKGMPRLRRRGNGNLYVISQIVTPEPGQLDDDQREALEAFADAGGEEVDTDTRNGLFDRLRESL